MRPLLIVLATVLAASICAAQCSEPRTIAGNFAADLDGFAMSGPGIWGRGDSWVFPLQLTPPAGHRVRILSISGDLTARFTTRGHGPAVAPRGTFTGFLAAVTTLPVSSGSAHADLAADDTLMYAQGDLSRRNSAVRLPFRESFAEDEANTVLGPEHRLYFKVAKYLDETGLATHLEITFSALRFCYQPE
jgi:hypothetical protein